MFQGDVAVVDESENDDDNDDDDDDYADLVESEIDDGCESEDEVMQTVTAIWAPRTQGTNKVWCRPCDDDSEMIMKPVLINASRCNESGCGNKHATKIQGSGNHDPSHRRQQLEAARDELMW